MIPDFSTFILVTSGLLAVITTLFVLLSNNPVYAVLYLVLSLFSVSLTFWSLGASFLAALEILVYAGAIMVLFLFVVMMLNLGSGVQEEDLRRPSRKQFLLPGVFAGLLAVLTVLAITSSGGTAVAGGVAGIGVKEVGQALFTRHYLGVELVSLILTIGIVGGMHLGRAASAVSEEHGGSALATYEKKDENPVKEAA